MKTFTSSEVTVAVVIASRGRAPEVQILLDSLAAGTRRPDRIVVVGASSDDWRDVSSMLAPDLLVAPSPGLPLQRNVGVRFLTHTGPRPDVIVFFDDDFRPEARWLETALAVFAKTGDVVGMTGVVLRDGAQTAAIDEAQAANVIAEWRMPDDIAMTAAPRLYGCNMAVRTAVFDYVQFDERLPLYGWLEDLDFSGQIRGRLILLANCSGVHLGSKASRVSGLRFGYSQVVNPLYLARKGTCPKLLAIRLVIQALASNSLRSFRLHPVFDYRGRLRGNVRALSELIRGRAAPERILLF